MLKHPSRLFYVVLAMGWAFDFLFWKKTPGISFAIFVILCLLTGFALSYGENLRPARTSLVLLIPLAFFVGMTFVRLEPFSLFLSYLLTFCLMTLLTHTFLGGRWFFYGFIDHIWGFLQLSWSTLSRSAIYRAQTRPYKDVAVENLGKTATIRQCLLPILRGLALALPVVVIFAALLASADIVFSHRLQSFITLFRIEKLPEYIFRIFYILVVAYLLGGVYLHALLASSDQRLASSGKSLVPRFLGFSEALIVLGCVDLLFAFFVGIQFRYFFGGQTNIAVEGFTYAEYARRGFGELVFVALFSLLLFLGLSIITRRTTTSQSRLFSGLGVTLVLLVAVILASAYQRLLLYEQAYGFTRLRTYTHVFMVWVGVILLVVVMLELTNQLRFITLAGLVSTLGFGISLNLINVDAFIVDQNVVRAVAGEQLDTAYLSTLSFDAVPVLVDLFQKPGLPEDVHTDIGAVLACQTARLESNGKMSWQSFHLARYTAQKLLQAHETELSIYPVKMDHYKLLDINTRGQWRHCWAGGVIE